jgi:hypothetical protein
VIGEKGVALVATVHGESLAALRSNVELNGLLGGFQSVTVGDATQKKLGAASKNLATRMGKPIFDIIVELVQVRLFDCIEQFVSQHVCIRVLCVCVGRLENTSCTTT